MLCDIQFFGARVQAADIERCLNDANKTGTENLPSEKGKHFSALLSALAARSLNTTPVQSFAPQMHKRTAGTRDESTREAVDSD